MLTLNFLMILLGCGVALFRWRWGIAAAILTGLLQDPLRKMVPGVPGFLTMASVPVWTVAIGNALYSGEVRFRGFFGQFPRFARWCGLFFVYLAIPAALSASYGRNSWQVTLLGAMMLGTMFCCLAAGWRFPRNDEDAFDLLAFYSVCTAVLLIGGPLDAQGWGDRYLAIGTRAMDHVWVTYRTGEAVFMLSGFFRGPDVMGWHAVMLTMVAGLLALRSRGWKRLAWVALALWGLPNVWWCGRRKMLSMLPIFWGILLLIIVRVRGARRSFSVLGVVLLLLGAGWYGVTGHQRVTALDTYYLTTIDEWDEQVWRHGVHSVVDTVQQAGFWGYGLGMSQQGLHHIAAEKPRIWQESGPSKLFAELGVPGALLFLALGYFLLRTIYSVVRLQASSPSYLLSAGLLAILGANLATAVVSAQIYGDPFVALLLAFLTGLALSSARIDPAAVEVAA